ncbi:SRPBCC domain-containing protein [Phytomonospora endophytica]|nr:SRPBCC domain-containing protein [Phytomonospora endophytica]
MELGTIEREIHVDASPEVVFDVVSRPEHISEWWSDEATLDDGIGELVWGERVDVQQFSVVTAEPPRLFAFRWAYPDGKFDAEAAALLVTFELTPSGTGTKLRMTESGFREMGWEAAKLEEMYNDHVTGWDHFVPRLGEYAGRLASS